LAADQKLAAVYNPDAGVGKVVVVDDTPFAVDKAVAVDDTAVAVDKAVVVVVVDKAVVAVDKAVVAVVGTLGAADTAAVVVGKLEDTGTAVADTMGVDDTVAVVGNTVAMLVIVVAADGIRVVVSDKRDSSGWGRRRSQAFADEDCSKDPAYKDCSHSSCFFAFQK
jgi:hypothetical protein